LDSTEIATTASEQTSLEQDTARRLRAASHRL